MLVVSDYSGLIEKWLRKGEVVTEQTLDYIEEVGGGKSGGGGWGGSLERGLQNVNQLNFV